MTRTTFEIPLSLFNSSRVLSAKWYVLAASPFCGEALFASGLGRARLAGAVYRGPEVDGFLAVAHFDQGQIVVFNLIDGRRSGPASFGCVKFERCLANARCPFRSLTSRHAFTRTVFSLTARFVSASADRWSDAVAISNGLDRYATFFIASTGKCLRPSWNETTSSRSAS